MQSLLHLATTLLEECGVLCGVDTTRDVKTVTDRFEDEGLSFLTITLPAFAKDFERSLALGRIDDAGFQSFRKGPGGLPRFMGGFLHLIFDQNTGTLLDEPSIDAIFFVRQVTLAFGKIFALPSNKRQLKAMQQYIETDREVQFHAASFSTAVVRSRKGYGRHVSTQVARPKGLHLVTDGPAGTRTSDQSGQHFCQSLTGRRDVGGFSETRRLRVLQERVTTFRQTVVHLFADALGPIDARAYARGLVDSAIPRHGPGQTAEFILGNAKYEHSNWPRRLEREFPLIEWAFPRLDLREEINRVNLLSLAAETPVRVISVPKTMKTSRIIGCEPVAMQYTQQAIMRTLVPALSNCNIAGPMIGFRDQTPNQRMALSGSSNGSLATLDLSEASDRVSLMHVRLLLEPWPNLRRMVLACRSRKASVPGIGVRHLSKYASMGSALTFPLEAMVFLAICLSAVAEARSVPVSRAFCKKMRGLVRVYGDDIIVPADCATTVVDWLEAFGLKVNASKSFWTGKFRESCGLDAYDGQDVTPVRFRQFPPTSRQQTEEIVSLISTRNQFYQLGLWRMTKLLDEMVLGKVPFFPIVEETSPIHGRHSVSFAPMAERIDKDLHTPLVKGLVVKAELPKDPLEGWAALMKWFLHVERPCQALLKRDSCSCSGCSPSGEPVEPLTADHLQFAGRSKTTHFLGWRRPY